MPFGEKFDPIYRTLIKPAVAQFGLTPVRADEMFAVGSIIEQIRAAIQQSRLCIADVSEPNPNVLYEVGIAHSLEKPTILLAQDASGLPFDLRSLRTFIYQASDLERGRVLLSKSIEIVLGSDRLKEARHLIDNGFYRAAAAVLSVVIEHDMRRLIETSGGADSSRTVSRLLGAGQALREMRNRGLISPQDVPLLEKAIQVRNRAVHELEEPKREEVLLMLEAAVTFRERYRGST